MKLPAPVPGLVIRYSYLWHGEYLAGREEGRKGRPCAIVAALRPADDAAETACWSCRSRTARLRRQRLRSKFPRASRPARLKERLRLDGERSWVVLSEWNEFTWPGPDLRRAPGADDSSAAYGMLPPAFFATIRDRFLALVTARAARRVSRTE